MKRNHTNKRSPKGGTSPYARYGKRPFQYSPAYYSWLRAMTGKILAGANQA